MKYLILLLALLTAPAFATDTLQVWSGNAVSSCQSALPVFDGNIRKRPLAIANEGTVSSFVNCNFLLPVNSYGIEKFEVNTGNIATGNKSVTCTGIAGIEYGPRNTYYPRAAQTVAPASLKTFTWSAAADNNGKRFNDVVENGAPNQNVGFQCLLAPGATITWVTITFRSK